MNESWLTTVDNPYDPFRQWDAWYAYDRRHGYNTCEFVDRLAHTSDQFTDQMNNQIIEDAIDEVVNLNIFGIYKKVQPTGPVPAEA